MSAFRASVSVVALVLMSFVFASPLLAQGDVPPVGGGGGGITNPLPYNDVKDLIVRFTTWTLGLVAVLALLGVVWGGIQMVVSVGDEGKLSKAKQIILWSLAGLAVSILAYSIVRIIAVEILNVSTVPVVYAQGGGDTIGLPAARPEGVPEFTVKSLAGTIVNFITGISAVIALTVFVFGGLMLILSAGNESRAEHAKQMMLYSLVGLLLIGVAYILVVSVGVLLGVISGGS